MSFIDKMPDGDIYRPNKPIIESFQWFKNLPEEFQTFGKDEDKIRIKVTSVHAGDISGNGRKYTEEALLRSVSSWNGLPFVVNHDMGLKIGNIEYTDFEGGALEHVVRVTKEPYVSLIREHSPAIKGVSINADYICNKCTKCPKMFSDEATWKEHMVKEHFVKDLPTQPHGIKGRELSLVYGREVPGLKTELEVMETSNGFNKLQETLVAEKGAWGIQATGGAAVGKTGVYTAEGKIPTHKEDKPKEPKKQEPEKAEPGSPDPLEEAQRYLENHDDVKVRECFDVCYKAMEQIENSIPEIKRQNELKTLELEIKDWDTSLKAKAQLKETQQLEELQKTIAEKDLKIIEYENMLDKVRGSFKAVAQETRKTKKVNPDLSYKPGQK